MTKWIAGWFEWSDGVSAEPVAFDRWREPMPWEVDPLLLAHPSLLNELG